MKDKITYAAISLYAKYGIKGVSMDRIAKSLNISKRTLYENFDSKEELVTAVVKTSLGRLSEIIAGAGKQARSPLESIVLISLNVIDFQKTFCPAFHKNLTYYSDAYEYLSDQKESFYDRILYLFGKGKESGIFLPEHNYDVIAGIFLTQFEDAQLDYQPSLIITFLRGICTVKGLDELLYHYETYQETNINHKIYS